MVQHRGRGRLGEVCHEFLTKGRLVYLESRVPIDRYEQDGNVKYFTKVAVSTMQMLDRREDQPHVEAKQEEVVIDS